MQQPKETQPKVQRLTQSTVHGQAPHTPSSQTLTPAFGQTLDANTILYLQRTLGNQGTQQLLRKRATPTQDLQRRAQPSQDHTDASETVALQANETEFVGGELSAKILTMPGAIQRKDNHGKLETLVPMADGSYVGLQQVESPQASSPLPISSLQRQTNGHAPAMAVSHVSSDAIQRIDKAKIGKRIGYGVANFFSEALIGPLTDLKHLVRVIHYNVQDDPDKEAKTDKIRERVKEEWVGKYPGARWMNVFHAIGTTAEKLAALAGVITLAATIASIWMGVAAPVATVAGLVALSLASVAFLVRALLSGVSLYKFKKTGDADFKKMAIVNLVQGIGNALAIVSFGVGTHMGGGISMDATPKGADSFGKELGAGLAFAIGTKAATISNDIIQSKRDPRIQREGEEGTGTLSPQATDLANTLQQADDIIPEQRQDAQKTKTDITTNQGVLNQSKVKVGNLLGETQGVKDKTNTMKSGAEATEAEAEQPDEGIAEEVSQGEVGEMEEQLTKGESTIDGEQAPESEIKKERKKGFWSKVKAKVKSVGKKIKGGLSAFFGRIMGVWRRFKALAAKLKAKVVAFMLRITGLDEEVKQGQALIQQDLEQQTQQVQPAIEYGQSVEELDNSMKAYR